MSLLSPQKNQKEYHFLSQLRQGESLRGKRAFFSSKLRVSGQILISRVEISPKKSLRDSPNLLRTPDGYACQARETAPAAGHALWRAPGCSVDRRTWGSRASKVEKESPLGTRVEYQLIAGERRLRAAKLAGLMSVPVVIRSVDDARNLEVSLVENIQREDLNALERAEAFKKLMEEFNLTQRDIAVKIGKSREAVANTLRLLELSSEVKELIRNNKLSEGHARALIGIKGKSDRHSIIEKILGEQLSVRQVEELARKIKKPVAALALTKDEQITRWETILEKMLGITVRIRKREDAYVIEFKDRRDTEAFFSYISRR